MKSGKIIALGLLALLPFAMKAQEAQEIEKLNARVDSLSQETTTLDKIVQKLSKFKVSAYIQGQFQYGQEDATLKVGDKNEHEDKGFNRFGIRRGRNITTVSEPAPYRSRPTTKASVFATFTSV